MEGNPYHAFMENAAWHVGLHALIKPKLGSGTAQSQLIEVRVLGISPDLATLSLKFKDGRQSFEKALDWSIALEL